MRKVKLRGSQVCVSRLIFGTGSLHHLGLATDRQRLLETAAEFGFSHFDTAPLYGFGQAERDLGRFLTQRPGAGVTTKVGLYPPGGTEQRPLATVFRKSAGRLFPRFSRAVADANVERARSSLDGSLQRLQRQHVELLLIHEPDAALLDSDEWQRWLSDERDNGRIGAFGLAGSPARLATLRLAAPDMAAILQSGGSDLDVFPELCPQIYYGVMRTGGLEGLKRHLIADPATAIVVSSRRQGHVAALGALAT